MTYNGNCNALSPNRFLTQTEIKFSYILPSVMIMPGLLLQIRKKREQIFVLILRETLCRFN